MRSRDEELAIRADVFRWLDEQFIGQGGYEIHSSVLRSYSYGGEHIPLLDRGKGIRNPATFSSTLSIMSGWKANRYSDYESDDGWITYHYRAGEGGDNTNLSGPGRTTTRSSTSELCGKAQRDPIGTAWRRSSHFLRCVKAPHIPTPPACGTI